VKLCLLAAAKEVCADKEESSERHSVFRILYYKACTRTGNTYLDDLNCRQNGLICSGCA